MIAPQPKCEICVKNTFLHFEFGRLIFEDTPSRTAYSFCVTAWFRWILMIDNYELRWIKLPVRSVCRHFISLSSNNQVSFLRGKCQALQWSIPLTHETHWESKPLICIIFYKGRLSVLLASVAWLRISGILISFILTTLSVWAWKGSKVGERGGFRFTVLRWSNWNGVVLFVFAIFFEKVILTVTQQLHLTWFKPFWITGWSLGNMRSCRVSDPMVLSPPKIPQVSWFLGFKDNWWMLLLMQLPNIKTRGHRCDTSLWSMLPSWLLRDSNDTCRYETTWQFFKGETRINMCLLEVEHAKSGNIFSCLVHANTFKQNLVQLRPRFFMQVANFETTLLGNMTLFCFVCLRVETGRIPFFYLCWASPFQLWFRQWISVGSSSNPFSCYRSLG